jgi:hypothetical protein
MSTPTISEQELDQHIKDCGDLMRKAFANGDPKAGYQHMQDMYAAIRSRTPEHQARMFARIDAAIDANWFQSPEALEMGKGAA